MVPVMQPVHNLGVVQLKPFMKFYSLKGHKSSEIHSRS